MSTSGRTLGIGGEIIIPIGRTDADYTGKILSFAMRGSVAGGRMCVPVLLVAVDATSRRAIGGADHHRLA